MPPRRARHVRDRRSVVGSAIQHAWPGSLVPGPPRVPPVPWVVATHVLHRCYRSTRPQANWGRKMVGLNYAPPYKPSDKEGAAPPELSGAAAVQQAIAPPLALHCAPFCSHDARPPSLSPSHTPRPRAQQSMPHVALLSPMPRVALSRTTGLAVSSPVRRSRRGTRQVSGSPTSSAASGCCTTCSAATTASACCPTPRRTISAPS